MRIHFINFNERPYPRQLFDPFAKSPSLYPIIVRIFRIVHFVLAVSLRHIDVYVIKSNQKSVSLTMC